MFILFVKDKSSLSAVAGTADADAANARYILTGQLVTIDIAKSKHLPLKAETYGVNVYGTLHKVDKWMNGKSLSTSRSQPLQLYCSSSKALNELVRIIKLLIGWLRDGKCNHGPVITLSLMSVDIKAFGTGFFDCNFQESESGNGRVSVCAVLSKDPTQGQHLSDRVMYDTREQDVLGYILDALQGSRGRSTWGF